MEPEDPKLKDKSILAVEFDAIGSAEFKVNMLHITPGQLFAAAAYLTWMAGNEAARLLSRAQIEIPRGRID